MKELRSSSSITQRDGRIWITTHCSCNSMTHVDVSNKSCDRIVTHYVSKVVLTDFFYVGSLRFVTQVAKVIDMIVECHYITRKGTS